MKSLFRNLIVLIITFSLICSCNDTSNNKRTSVNYPNGGSELAWLMRNATDQMEQQRTIIKNGESIKNFPIDIDHILTAKPTEEGKTSSEAYQRMAKQLIIHLQQKDSVPLEGQIKYFNKTVSQCVNCHETQCPGPNVRIKKLYINQ